MYQDHTTAKALATRYQRSRPAGRKTRGRRPPAGKSRSLRARPPIVRPVATS